VLSWIGLEDNPTNNATPVRLIFCLSRGQHQLQGAPPPQATDRGYRVNSTQYRLLVLVFTCDGSPLWLDVADFLHIASGQCKMDDFRIFLQVSIAVCSWNSRDSLLHHPTEHDLSRCSAVLLSESEDRRMCQNWIGSLLMLCSKWAVCLISDVVRSAKVDSVPILMQWIKPVLNNMRLDFGKLDELLDLLEAKVGDSNRTSLFVMINLLQRLPSFLPSTSRALLT
jgi:hypothetical protein